MVHKIIEPTASHEDKVKLLGGPPTFYQSAGEVGDTILLKIV